MTVQMSKRSDLIKQMFFFGFVGAVSFGIDLVITVTFFNVLHFPAFLASGIGFLSAFFFNFPMNRKKVFKHTKYDRFSLKTQVILYVGLSIFNLFMTSLLVQVLVASNLVSIAFAKVIVTMLVAMWNFIIFKFYIFSNNTIANKGADERTM